MWLPPSPLGTAFRCCSCLLRLMPFLPLPLLCKCFCCCCCCCCSLLALLQSLLPCVAVVVVVCCRGAVTVAAATSVRCRWCCCHPRVPAAAVVLLLPLLLVLVLVLPLQRSSVHPPTRTAPHRNQVIQVWDQIIHYSECTKEELQDVVFILLELLDGTSDDLEPNSPSFNLSTNILSKLSPRTPPGSGGRARSASPGGKKKRPSTQLVNRYEVSEFNLHIMECKLAVCRLLLVVLDLLASEELVCPPPSSAHLRLTRASPAPGDALEVGEVPPCPSRAPSLCQLRLPDAKCQLQWHV